MWGHIEKIFGLYSHYPDMYWVAKRYYEQSKEERTESYKPSYESALEELTEPYSRKSLYSYMEKFYYFPSYKCKVSVAWKISVPVPVTITMPKRWPYSEYVNYSMLRMMNFGLSSRVADKYYEHKRVKCPLEYRGASLGKFKVMGASVILSFGMILSLIVLAYEILYYYLSNILFEKRELAAFNSPKSLDGSLKSFCARWGPVSKRHDSLFRSELSKLLL